MKKDTQASKVSSADSKNKVKESVVKEYYEAESWQFSWCWD
ncbi:MAG: hypothetical protein ACD_2C00016G0011 [uncultured bacterium (gcode 4)]|uniref:Uncharacterized protein n=1 Tax=uncultured bacterium (gcode 4) TaxID=1234023 RepID=K2H332_9BACT|nr:MAG: hypothetical protein ACD_2C00016G0011 [uncultured bacterium (gcode 4)]